MDQRDRKQNSVFGKWPGGLSGLLCFWLNGPKQTKTTERVQKKNESRGKKTLRRYRRGDWMDWSDGSLQVISVNLCVPQIYSLFRHVPAHQFVRRPSLEKWPRTENVTERHWNSVRERSSVHALTWSGLKKKSILHYHLIRELIGGGSDAPPPQDQGGYCTIEVINTPQPSVTSRPIRNQPCYTIYKNRNLLPPTPSSVWEAEDLFSRRVEEPGAVDPNNLLSEVLHKRITECYTVGLKVKAAIIRLCTHCKSIWSCGCPWVSPASDMGLIWYRCVGVAPGKIIATDQSNCLM